MSDHSNRFSDDDRAANDPSDEHSQDMIDYTESSCSDTVDDTIDKNKASSEHDDDKSAAFACYEYEYIPNQTTKGSYSLEKKKQKIVKIEEAAQNVCEIIRKYGNAPLPPLNPDGLCGKRWKIDRESAWANVPLAMQEISTAGNRLKQAWDDSDDEDLSQMGDVTPKMWWGSVLDNDSAHKSTSNTHHLFSEQSIKRYPNLDEITLTMEERHQFEQVHLEWITNAFSEELEGLRKGQWEMKYNSGATTKRQREKVSNENDHAIFDLDPNQHSFVFVDTSKKEHINHDESLKTVASAEADIDVKVLANLLASRSNYFSSMEKKILLRAKRRGNMQSGKGANRNSLSLHDLRRRELGFL